MKTINIEKYFNQDRVLLKIVIGHHQSIINSIAITFYIDITVLMYTTSNRIYLESTIDLWC